MITAIAVENFKGVREQARLVLKPLTLLFGPNSAGKSTFLHAIHYAREIFERGNVDAERTAFGVPLIDLGGFRNFVHERDVNRTVSLKFEFSLPVPQDDRNLKSPLAAYDRLDSVPDRDPRDYSKFGANVTTASVEVRVAWVHEKPVVEEYRVELDRLRVGELAMDRSQSKGVVLRLHDAHPIWRVPARVAVLNDPEPLLSWHSESIRVGLETALPDWGAPLRFRAYPAPAELSELVSRAMVRPGELLRAALSRFRYLGPFRELPPREFVPPTFHEPTRWITGMGAWDRLNSPNAEALISVVNDWIGRADRLDTGYRVRRLRYKHMELDGQTPGLAELPTFSRLVLEQVDKRMVVHAHDVGVGLSQLLPVVVAALDDEYPGLTVIEQPELHLHPRLQCELGDLFIEGALGPKRKTLLIETHSEHLILRILRRVRDTSRGVVSGPAIRPEDVAVWYVSQEQGRTALVPMRIDESGEFVDLWPDKFFEHDFYERFG